MEEGRSSAVEAEQEEDLFVAEPAVSADEDDSDDEHKHRRLLDAITALGGRKRKKRMERTEAGLQVSEFTVSAEGAGKKLRLADLIRPISAGTELSKVKNQLNRLTEAKSLEKPLSKEETEKIQRLIAYEKTSAEVAKWQNVVQENRSAEQLLFPLNAQKEKPDSLEATIGGWKASTPLEMEVFSVLNRNKPPTKTLLTPKEMASLRAMSLEEAKERRAELQKVRVLESCYAAKAHRQKKIKSKKYHRVLKKVKQKKYLKKFEELRKEDPDAALEELEKLERARIKERMTLKHQSSGKWAKAKAIMAKYDEGARKAIHEQLQKNKELTQKIKAASEDEEEEEEKEDEVVPDFVNDAQIAVEGANPWMTGKLSSDPNEPDVRTEEETPMGEKVTEKSNEEEEKEEEEEEEEEEMEETLLKEFEDRRERRKNQTSLDPERGPEPEGAVTAAEVSRFNTLFQKMLEQNKEEERKERRTRSSSTTVTEPEVVEEEKTEQSTTREEEEEAPLLMESMERAQTMEDLEALGEQLPDEEPQEPPTKKPDKKAAPQPTRKKKSKNSELIDLEKLLPTRMKQIRMPLLPSMVEEEESEHLHQVDDNEKKQKMIIQEAFAGDDVIKDFLEEKRAAEEAETPKSICLALPGWGEWGGTNLKMSARKRRRYTIQPPPAPPRQDTRLPNVIINEKRNIMFAAHQVTKIPSNFTCRKQFQSSIRAPVGNTWNPESAVRKLTIPPVVTKLGHIIEPITEDVFQKHSATKRSDVTLNPKTDGTKKRFGAAPNPRAKPKRRPAKEFLKKKKQ